jgi:hypothetical protein
MRITWGMDIDIDARVARAERSAGEKLLSRAGGRRRLSEPATMNHLRKRPSPRCESRCLPFPYGYRTLMTAVRALLVIRASLVAIVKPRRVA